MFGSVCPLPGRRSTIPVSSAPAAMARSSRGPTIGVDLAGEIFVDAALRLRSQFQTDQALRSCAHPVRNIVARDHEIGAIVRLAAKKDVDVRIVGVPMVDADPVEFGPEIAFGFAHEIAGEGAQVFHFGCVFRADDEPKMMPVVLAAFDEGGGVRCIGAGVEQSRLLLVAGDAFSPQIGDMGHQRR